MPKNYKICLTTSLLFWTLNLCSDFIKLHHEVDKLKSIFYKNSYPRDLVKTCIKGFLEKILAPKTMVSILPKKDLVIALLYLDKLLYLALLYLDNFKTGFKLFIHHLVLDNDCCIS